MAHGKGGGPPVERPPGDLAYDLCGFSDNKLSPVVVQDLRETWWAMLRHGRRLPAERGVILIKGQRP